MFRPSRWSMDVSWDLPKKTRRLRMTTDYSTSSFTSSKTRHPRRFWRGLCSHSLLTGTSPSMRGVVLTLPQACNLKNYHVAFFFPWLCQNRVGYLKSVLRSDQQRVAETVRAPVLLSAQTGCVSSEQHFHAANPLWSARLLPFVRTQIIQGTCPILTFSFQITTAVYQDPPSFNSDILVSLGCVMSLTIS